MERIKIIHVTQSVSGVATYLHQIIKHINKNRFEIILVSSEKEIEQLSIEFNLRYYYVPMSRSLNLLTDIKLFFSLRKVFKKEKPALVHLHTAKAGFAGRIAAKTLRCKSLFTPHGGSYLSFTGYKRMLFLLLETIAKRYTYKMLAVSQSEALRFINEVGIPAKDVYVIANALDVDEKKNLFSKEKQILKGRYKIGTIGRLTYQKNPLLFVDIAHEVVRQNPGVHFYFLGAGFHDHLRKETEAAISKYGIGNNIELLEKGDREYAANFLQQLDVFILPSLYEGLPYSLLEAMLATVPCVVSKCDGNNDVIHNNINGFSCITVKEFANTIINLINDAGKAKEIGEAGRNYVIANHDIKNAVKELEDIYSKIAI